MLRLGQTLKSRVGRSASASSSFAAATASATAIGTICFVGWQTSNDHNDEDDDELLLFATKKSKLLATSSAPSLPSRNTTLPSRDEQISTLLSSSTNKTEFDVLVIGGGATGAGAALDATTRGLSTVLIEKGDFGNETSSRST